jgi:small acid-soluble spore protein I (minor)
MNLDIRQAVKANLVNANGNDILSTINDSMTIKEESVLPGLGVMFEVYWRNLDEPTKTQIANSIANNLK